MASYWRERELAHIQKQIETDAAIARRLRDNQLRALAEIQEQIEAFYGRYAAQEGISMQEARKRISSTDVDRYKDKAKRYVAERNFTSRANEEMRIYNVTMQINRLELLKRNIELSVIATVSDEERILFEELTKAARAEFERQSSILGASIEANEQNLKSIVNSSFQNATWSDRLWNNQAALRAELDVLLNRGIVQGLNPRQLARELRKTFDTSIYNSERLIRTELGRVQIDVQRDSYDKSGFDQYEYIAEPTACPICSRLDREIFDVADMEIGVNAPVMHPNCRCSTAAYMDRGAFEADLAERGL